MRDTAVPGILIQGVSRRFGSVAAVDNIDLAIGNGEFVTLLGPSGCGKTTTLRMVAGLDQNDDGRISIGARVVSDAAEGWNPGQHDAECFHAVDPNGFLLGLIHGKPVGCISAAAYDDQFGFIGLYIVKRAAGLLGHQVEVRSTEGRGSCFTVVASAAQCSVRWRMELRRGRGISLAFR